MNSELKFWLLTSYLIWDTAYKVNIIFLLTQQEFVSTVNNFVQEDKKTAWEAIPADNRRRSLTKLMHAAEETTAFLSQNFPKMAEVDVNASDMGTHTTKHIEDVLLLFFLLAFFFCILADKLLTLEAEL